MSEESGDPRYQARILPIGERVQAPAYAAARGGSVGRVYTHRCVWRNAGWRASSVGDGGGRASHR
ncbi:hypothetical protein CN135_10940 [Sinorhizobium meliloti]|nr:hypothetical protein CN135_10940 [Sinorhizobium meliloti]